MTYIERRLEQEILKNLSSPDVIAIVGPRQAGKTTLMTRIYKKHRNAVFLTFGDVEKLALFEDSPAAFVQAYVEPYDIVFIDEFHHSQTGGKKLKFILDMIPGKKIIVAGAAAVNLTIKGLSFLEKKVKTFEILPLAFGEFLRFKDQSLYNRYLEFKNCLSDIENGAVVPEIPHGVNLKCKYYLEEYILYGGFPGVVSQKDVIEKAYCLKTITNTYLLKDIRAIGSFTNELSFLKLLRALALQTGRLIEYKEMSKLISATFHNVKKYLSYLESTYLLKLISPFFTDKTSELVRNPKVFFIDTGLRNSLIDDFKPLDRRVDKDSLYENFVFSCLNIQDGPARYWRSKGGE